MDTEALRHEIIIKRRKVDKKENFSVEKCASRHDDNLCPQELILKALP
jgi:hypothetical protein